MCALIKVVKFLQLQWQMEVGKFGKKQPGLLWMPTIISLIKLKTIFAENIAILHQGMGLLQILLLWHTIKMETHI